MGLIGLIIQKSRGLAVSMVPYNPVLLQRHARQHDSNILNSSKATPGVAGCQRDSIGLGMFTIPLVPLK